MTWIKVEDGVPEVGAQVLAYCDSDIFDGGPCFIVKYLGDANSWDVSNDSYPNSSNYCRFSPTHWMPLPEKPNDMD